MVDRFNLGIESDCRYSDRVKRFLATMFVVTSCSDAPPAVVDAGVNEDAGDLPTGVRSLVASTDWSPVPFADDPFNPPDSAMCDADNGMRAAELGGEPTYEIETLLCGWGTASQMLKEDIPAGAQVSYRVWHFDLVGETEANIAIRVDDWDIFNVSIQQPADAELHADSLLAPRDFSAGTPVYFHVHNHGANEYSLVELSVNGP